MNILGIIHQMPGESICYDKSIITYMALMESLGLRDKLYLVVEDEEVFYVDFSKMLSEQSFSSIGIDDWDKFEGWLNKATCEMYPAIVMVPQWQHYCETIGDVKKLYRRLTPFSSNAETELNIHSVENNIGINVAYSSRTSPFTRNVKTIKWTLKDLVFTQVSSVAKVNFRNTIPIVNGLACYPSILESHSTLRKFENADIGKELIPDATKDSGFRAVTHDDVGNTYYPLEYVETGDELFAYEGANLLRKNSSVNKGLVLIDFSGVGDIETHLLSKCEDLSNIDTGSHNKELVLEGPPTKVKFTSPVKQMNSDKFVIKFKLPSNASQGYPVVCIAGRLFFPDFDDLTYNTVGEDKIITLTLTRVMLEKILASNLQKFGKESRNTHNITINVDDFLNYLFVDHTGDYYNEEINEENTVRKYFDDTCIPFVTIIKTSNKLVYKKSTPLGTIKPDKFRFELDAGGLMINTETREIIDYVRVPYDSCTLVTIADWKPLEILNRDTPYLLHGSISATSKYNYQRRDAWNYFSSTTNLRDLDKYYLLDIAKV